LLARIEAYRGNEQAARDLLTRIREAVRTAARRDNAAVLRTPGEGVLLTMIDLSTRDTSADEWEKLLERSASDSVEQESIEVADLYGAWALRRGRIELARRAFEEAARRALRIPNIMDARIQNGLRAAGVPST
jgi:hypothetical protein